ncbi:unnamed protein product [Mytilus coruscus]|uniref:BTB domain-containing protein n=1 Tax=Mytilus coruscus TaxID=42192 RepID=A0A6J8EGZ6_MYTCO|nr:unnamed protein product [Mytilus coruscus]
MEQPNQSRRLCTRTAKESISKEKRPDNGSRNEAEGLTDSEEDLQELTNYEKNLASPFNEQNIALVFSQSKLYIQKEHLITVSPVFEAMFSPKFLEGSLTEIPLPDKKLSHFVYFLRYLFPGFDDKITEDTVHDMLPLADEYQTDDLKKRIEKFLVKDLSSNSSYSFSSEQIIEKILEAERYKLNGYLNACIDVASRKKIKSLTKSPKFEEISQNTKLKISLKRCEDIDDMYTSVVKVDPKNTSYAGKKQHNRGAPLEYEVGLQDVGEFLKPYMTE